MNRTLSRGYRQMRALRYCIGCLVGLILVGAPAALAAPAISNLAPANGSTLVAPATSSSSYGTVRFNFTCPRYETSYHTTVRWSSYFVKVATSPEPGPEGFPATAFFVGMGSAFPTNAAETECRSDATTPITPGTYYWQVRATDCDLPHCGNVGPIWSFNIVREQVPTSQPPPPATSQPSLPSIQMTAREAPLYLRRMIRSETRGKIRQLRRTCWRYTSSSRRCKASFRVGTRKYSGFTTFRHVRSNGEVFWTYDFRGTLTKLRCSRKCTKKVRWTS